ncbi:MAG: sodium/proline symporter PutP [Andreesenia angusta]|nr:sodium/proline symporter PutP [Andreesenia angusta]
MEIPFSTFAAFLVYLGILLIIGLYFLKKSQNMKEYFLGGRQLNSWVTALSAQASDMSGWLLMGLPAAAYISGISSGWIAIGLAIGTYANWKIIAKRLRNYTAICGDSITIPEYLQNRFHTESPVIRSICSVIIFIFFLIYTASAFNAGAVLFRYLFGFSYTTSLIIGCIVIISYTLMGGFFAVSWTDFVQGMLMFVTIVIVPILAYKSSSAVNIDTIKEIGGPGFLSMMESAEGKVKISSIVSSLAWGLGYLGMPHILTRFMAIKSSSMIKKSRIIAMVWVLISLTASVTVGLVGKAYLLDNGIEYTNLKDAEAVFMTMITGVAPGFLAGILLSAIMAAVMSTADSQLLVTASALTNDFYKAVVKRDATGKELIWVSRISVFLVALIAFVIAYNPDNTVMSLVSYAWAGLGASFGPVIFLSLFWKRMTAKGAIAGMISGGVTVLLWESFGIENAIGLYSIIPGYIVSLLSVYIFSIIDEEPSVEVLEEFNTVKNYR